MKQLTGKLSEPAVELAISVAAVGKSKEWVEALLQQLDLTTAKAVSWPDNHADVKIFIILWSTYHSLKTLSIAPVKNINKIRLLIWIGKTGSGDVCELEDANKDWHHLLAFVHEQGGGLLVATCPWGFEQVNIRPFIFL